MKDEADAGPTHSDRTRGTGDQPPLGLSDETRDMAPDDPTVDSAAMFATTADETDDHTRSGERGARIFAMACDETETRAGMSPALNQALQGLPDLEGAMGNYTILGELGRGGMGIVYRARDQAQREVALKVVRGDRRVNLARFWREGEVTAALDHPGIVRVHSAGTHEGLSFLAYELVDQCRDMKEALEDVGWRQSLDMLLELSRALAFAHERGVVHRDIKFTNVLVDGAGKIRLADFGLALVREDERLTKSGAVLGTPLFMSPEQILGKRDQVGPWTDVWALGVMLHFILSGTYPFRAQTLVMLMNLVKHREVAPPQLLDPDMPPGLQDVCLKALAKDPQQRHADAGAFAADLETVLGGGTVEPCPRRRLPAIALVALVLAILGGVFLATRGEEASPASSEDTTRTPDPPLETRKTNPPQPDPFRRNYLGQTAFFTDERAKADATGDPLKQAEAQWRVGEMLRDGNQVGPDRQAALLWFERAARTHPRWAAKLGKVFEKGDGLSADPAAALKWYRLASEGGDADAKIRLVMLLRDDPQHLEEVLKLLEEAAELGHPRAQFALGNRYLNADGVKQDHAQAHHWLGKASQQGNPTATYTLAESHLMGRGDIEQDIKNGVDLLQEAIQQGGHLAPLELADIYLEGRGPIAKDEARAVRVLRKEANRKDANAQAMRKLAQLLRAGRGVKERDPKAADAWEERARRARNY